MQEILDSEQSLTALCDDPNPSATFSILVSIADLLLMLLHLRTGRRNAITSFLRKFPSNLIPCLLIARVRRLNLDDSTFFIQAVTTDAQVSDSGAHGTHRGQKKQTRYYSTSNLHKSTFRYSNMRRA
jgi:hypothetical protein